MADVNLYDIETAIIKEMIKEEVGAYVSEIKSITDDVLQNDKFDATHKKRMEAAADSLFDYMEDMVVKLKYVVDEERSKVVAVVDKIEDERQTYERVLEKARVKMQVLVDKDIKFRKEAQQTKKKIQNLQALNGQLIKEVKVCNVKVERLIRQSDVRHADFQEVDREAVRLAAENESLKAQLETANALSEERRRAFKAAHRTANRYWESLSEEAKEAEQKRHREKKAKGTTFIDYDNLLKCDICQLGEAISQCKSCKERYYCSPGCRSLDVSHNCK